MRGVLRRAARLYKVRHRWEAPLLGIVDSDAGGLETAACHADGRVADPALRRTTRCGAI